MRNKKKWRFLLILIILASFSVSLNAEDRRIIPLDVYLVIDGSSSFQDAKNDAVAWINAQVVDRVLMEGDNITIWTAGDTPALVYSGAISSTGAETADIKAKLASLAASGTSADFSGTLQEAAARAARTPQNRLSCTILATASAEGLESSLTGDSRSLFKWFRSEKYERWQVLVVGTNIAQKVREAAALYMRS